MKIEHNTEFTDLFHTAVGLLHKMIMYKLHAMDTCNRQQIAYFEKNKEGEPHYHLKMLTNKQIAKMSP